MKTRFWCKILVWLLFLSANVRANLYFTEVDFCSSSPFVEVYNSSDDDIPENEYVLKSGTLVRNLGNDTIRRKSLMVYDLKNIPIDTCLVLTNITGDSLDVLYFFRSQCSSMASYHTLQRDTVVQWDGKFLFEYSVFKQKMETKGEIDSLVEQERKKLIYTHDDFANELSMKYEERVISSRIANVPLKNEYDEFSSIIVLPNPVTSFLLVKGSPHTVYKLFSISGILFGEGYIKNESEKIDMRTYPDGMYILSIENGKEIKTFKIEKTGIEKK